MSIDIVSNQITSLLPKVKNEIFRLNELQKATTPKIIFAGKFNHGKSLLGNAITGSQFSVNDKRETVAAELFHHQGIDWIDTPGINADVLGHDDKVALDVTLEKADIIYFVHTVTVGELDKSEIDYLTKLNNLNRKIIFILSQIDNTEKDINRIDSQILKQLSLINKDIKIVQVAAKREFHSNAKIRSQSGLMNLQRVTDQSINDVESNRRHEIAMLKRKITNARNQMLFTYQRKLSEVEQHKNQISRKLAL